MTGKSNHPLKINSETGLIETLARIQKSILVIGDPILDHWVFGSVERRSPESPTLVLKKEEEKFELGGATNVAAQLAGFGLDVHQILPTSSDHLTTKISRFARSSGVQIENLKLDGWITSLKTRFVCENHHLLRVDHENPRGKFSVFEDRIIAAISAKVATLDPELIVLSDYNKGMLSPRTISTVLSLANEKGIKTLVDPKKSLETYQGCDVLKANSLEAELDSPPEIDRATDKANGMISRLNISKVVITLGANGAVGATPGGTFHTPAEPINVVDVSGAGDAFLVGLVVGELTNRPLGESIKLASTLAGYACSSHGNPKLSTYVSELENLSDRRGESATNEVSILKRIVTHRHLGKKIVFTNGVFDLLHPGHIALLREAKSLGDILVVGINSDSSVKRLKGPSRPVQSLEDRIRVIQALRSVDFVVPFNDDTPKELIAKILPDVLVKGADYQKNEIVGAEDVISAGGEVVTVELIENKSSSSLIDAISMRQLPHENC